MLTKQAPHIPFDESRWLVASRATEHMLIIFAAVCIGATLVSFLGSLVFAGHWRAFDEWMVKAFRSAADLSVPVGSRAVLIAVRDITALGGTLPLVLLVSAVATYLFLKRHIRTAIAVVASSVLGVIASQLLKALIDRGRPDIVPQLVNEVSGSFPSGHAMMSAIIYLTLGSMLARLEPDRRVRIFIMGTAIALPVAIGFSRVYLGVHWPSDVAGGWCLGALWVLGVSRILDAVVKQGETRG